MAVEDQSLRPDEDDLRRDLADQSDEIDRLRARIAELEAVLRGVARGLERLGGDWPDVAADIRKNIGDPR